MAEEEDKPAASMAFRSLLARIRPGMTRQIEKAQQDVEAQKEDKEPSVDERVAVELMHWARARACRDVFIPEVLQPAIDLAKLQRFSEITSHPLTAYWTGYEKALEDLIERFGGWQTGQVADTSASPKE